MSIDYARMNRPRVRTSFPEPEIPQFIYNEEYDRIEKMELIHFLKEVHGRYTFTSRILDAAVDLCLDLSKSLLVETFIFELSENDRLDILNEIYAEMSNLADRYIDARIQASPELF